MRYHHSWRTTGAITFGLFVVAALAIICVVPLRRGYTVPYGSRDSIASLEQAILGGSLPETIPRAREGDNASPRVVGLQTLRPLK